MIYLNSHPLQITLAYKSRISNSVYQCKGSAIFEPKGRCLILGFCFHHWNKEFPREFVQEAINQDIGIVYLCDCLPKDPIVDDHIVYVITGFEWFTHLVFKDLQVFKGVFHNETEDGKRFADILANRGGVYVPLLGYNNKLDCLKNMTSIIPKPTCDILIESFDGLGDVLMALPVAKTLHSQGNKVSFLTRSSFAPIFENIDFITQLYNEGDTIPTYSFGKYVTLTHKLSDYTKEYNQQHRMYSTAWFCDVAPKELITNKSIIILTDKEKEWAKETLSQYKNTVGIGWESAGYSRGLHPLNTQKLCDALTLKKQTPIILSANSKEFNNAINLGGKLNLRQLFSIVWALDSLITVDTGILHIAGAFGTPTVALFGPIPSEWRCSTYKNCIVVKPKLSCCPCMDGQFIERAKRGCNQSSEGYCLEQISTKQILKALYIKIKNI